MNVIINIVLINVTLPFIAKNHSWALLLFFIKFEITIIKKL